MTEPRFSRRYVLVAVASAGAGIIVVALAAWFVVSIKVECRDKVLLWGESQCREEHRLVMEENRAVCRCRSADPEETP